MEQLWVALLAVGIVFFSSGITGSVWHGLAGVPGYPQLIPYNLAYTISHSPVALPQIHGLEIDEALANSRNEQGQSPTHQVVEASVDETGKFITQEQLFKQIFRDNPESSEGTNVIEEGVETPSTGVETASSSAQSDVQASPTVADLLVPQSALEASSVQNPNSPLPIPIAPQQEGLLHPQGISTNSVGGVYIKAEEGRLQMQAALVTGEDSPNVSVGDVLKMDGDSAPVIVSELPASSANNNSKTHSQTNVNLNVNVNVNGDGKGSVINSTSVAEITAPIKTGHKKCD